MFPVLQYFDGEGQIIFPPEWATMELTPKGETPEITEAAEEPVAEPMEATETFKLGVMGPFSGAAARTGKEFRGAVEMAFENVDYQVGPYNIELVWIDSQSDPAKATEAYEEAVVQKEIQAGLLNWHSSVSVACMEVTAKHQIPHFFAMGATEVVNETWRSDPEKYYYWVGKGWASPAKLAKSYVQAFEYYIEEGAWQPESKTAAIWGEDTDWGRSFGNGMREELEAAGWEIISEDYLPLDQTEFYPLLNRLKEQNPAVVAGTGSAAPQYTALIKQAYEVGLPSLLVIDGLGWAGEWYELTGEASDYVVDQIPGWATEEGKQFAEEFEERFDLKASTAAAGQAYDYASMFIDVAQKTYDETGELSKETLADFAKNKVETGDWSFTDGIVHQEYMYTEETMPDPVVGKGYWMFPVLQYFDGAGQIIFPPEWAVQDLQPKP
jgi:branched-chain amino acid transport system substrate-binding protein